MAAPQTDPQYKLRLPEALRDRIKAAADSNGRSMNAEIVFALEEKYPQKFDIREELAELSRMAERLAQHPSDEAAERFKILAESVHSRIKAEEKKLELKLMGLKTS